LGKPEQYDQNVLHIALTYKDKPLGIQTPRLSFENTDTFRILFEGKTPEKVSEFYSLFSQLDNFISTKTSETLRKYITSDITTRDLYCPVVRPPVLLGQPPYVNVNVLDNVVPQNLDSFPSFGIGTFVLALKYIVVTPTSARSVWSIVQCLVHLPKMRLPTDRMSIKEPVEADVEPEKMEFEQITINLK